VQNAYHTPEITVQELADKINSGHKVLILDIREKIEIDWVSLPVGTVVVVPMSELTRVGLDAIPAEVRNWKDDLVILCHHGIRSAQVVAWLWMQGWENVINLAGGIDAYAREIDPSLPTY